MVSVCVCVFVIVWFIECGGKMHLREGEYEKAHTDFFEAFKNYDESGSPRYVSVIIMQHLMRCVSVRKTNRRCQLIL